MGSYNDTGRGGGPSTGRDNPSRLPIVPAVGGSTRSGVVLLGRFMAIWQSAAGVGGVKKVLAEFTEQEGSTTRGQLLYTSTPFMHLFCRCKKGRKLNGFWARGETNCQPVVTNRRAVVLLMAGTALVGNQY
jgi:hypothetical protein